MADHVYDPAEIEPRWQRVWADERTWEVGNDDIADDDVYVLEMLPYPSGEPHIGHLKVYSVGDAVAHYNRRIGKRVLQRTESYLLMVPVFRTVYAPVKQLIVAFSPDNEAGFKRVVAIDEGQRGIVLGFLTREFSLDRGQGPETMVAVYVPTNHLYLGDVIVVPREQALFPDISVEEGIRIFLTGGMALPGRVRGQAGSGSRATDIRA